MRINTPGAGARTCRTRTLAETIPSVPFTHPVKTITATATTAIAAATATTTHHHHRHFHTRHMSVSAKASEGELMK